MRRAGIETLLLCLALGLPAAAQDGEDERRGARFGPILVKPVVEGRVTYDDNIFREESGETDSLILRPRASVEVETDWRRHSLSVIAAVEAAVFSNSPRDDAVDASLEMEGVLDISRAARLRLRAGAGLGHEPRGADDAPAALAGPVETRRVFAELTGQYAPGWLRLQPFVGVAREDFVDEDFLTGGVSNQDDRDRLVLRGGFKAGYRIGGGVEAFAEGVIRRTDFDSAVDDGGVDRDSLGLRGLIGIELTPRGPLSGAIALGWQRRDFDDAGLRDFSGLAAEARVNWAPTRLIDLALVGRRGVEETSVAGASAVRVAEISLKGTYEVLRVLDATAEIGFERRAFRGADRRDEILTLGAGLVWRARPGAEITAGVRRLEETSNAPGEDATTHLLFLGARYRF